MSTGKIRRRDNGTVDIDAYRQEALMLRAQARTRFFQKLGHMAPPWIGAAAIILIYLVLLPRLVVPPSASAMPAQIPLVAAGAATE